MIVCLINSTLSKKAKIKDLFHQNRQNHDVDIEDKKKEQGRSGWTWITQSDYNSRSSEERMHRNTWETGGARGCAPVPWAPVVVCPTTLFWIHTHLSYAPSPVSLFQVIPPRLKFRWGRKRRIDKAWGRKRAMWLYRGPNLAWQGVDPARSLRRPKKKILDLILGLQHQEAQQIICMHQGPKVIVLLDH